MCQTLYFHKWSPHHTSVTTIPVDHNAQHQAAVSMVAPYTLAEESHSPSNAKDTRHWWHIDRDTPVGGLGMAFASLQGASSDIHQAQRLSGDKYPQSDVWGDPNMWFAYATWDSPRRSQIKNRSYLCDGWPARCLLGQKVVGNHSSEGPSKVLKG
jgi:hypothetical protein